MLRLLGSESSPLVTLVLGAALALVGLAADATGVAIAGAALILFSVLTLARH